MAVDYFSRVGRVESGNNPNARNPNSSASGQFQFIDSTYLNYARKMMPGMSDQELLARKNDPQVQRQAMEMFTNDNRNALTSAGHQATDGNLYLAHFAGPGGAVKVLSADPNTPVADVLGAGAVKANGFLGNMTAGDLQKWAENKMNGTTGVQTEQNAQQQSKTPWTDSMLQGGPMALFGYGQQGYDWGNALIGAGAALASVADPRQGAAIAALRSSGQKPNDVDVSVDNKTGVVTMVNRRTGEVRTQQNQGVADAYLNTIRAQKKIEDEMKDYKPSNFTERTFQENHEGLQLSANKLDELKQFQQALKSGDLDLSLVNRIRTKTLSAADQQNPKLNTANAFESFLTSLQNDSLRLNKGTQTEGDAVRAMQEFMPSAGSWNNQMTETALTRVARSYSANMERLLDENNNVLKRSEKAAKYFDPEETFRTRYNTLGQAVKGDRSYFEEEYKRLTTAPPQQPQQTQQQQRDPNKLKNIFGF